MSEPLQIGKLLPEMETETANGRKTTVQAHLGGRQTLVYLLHGTWCPECVGQYHLLQRYLPRIKETDTELIVVSGEESDTLSAFLQSTQPALEYTVVADPMHIASQAVKAGDDTIAIIVDREGVVRWFERWPVHQDEPGYQTILKALKGVQEAEEHEDD